MTNNKEEVQRKILKITTIITKGQITFKFLRHLGEQLQQKLSNNLKDNVRINL